MNLPAEIVALIEGLRRQVADLQRENQALRAENAELRRRLDQDSSTSSKPPSSDGLRKKPRIAGSLRGFGRFFENSSGDGSAGESGAFDESTPGKRGFRLFGGRGVRGFSHNAPAFRELTYRDTKR